MSQVTRIVHRRTNPGFEKEYEELARGMLEACSKATGYLFSTMIPPRVEGEDVEFAGTLARSSTLHTIASLHAAANSSLWSEDQQLYETATLLAGHGLTDGR